MCRPESPAQRWNPSAAEVNGPTVEAGAICEVLRAEPLPRGAVAVPGDLAPALPNIRAPPGIAGPQGPRAAPAIVAPPPP
eukprot:10391140-Alexandrium_andersonii.AAC.1